MKLRVGLAIMVASDVSSRRPERCIPCVQLSGGVLTVEQPATGDGDGDGRVTSFDALLALRMSARLAKEDLVMDMDGDGRVTVQDARRILAMAAARWEG